MTRFDAEPTRDAEWQRIVREAARRGRTAESIGMRWDEPGWTLGELRYRARLSPLERRQLEQDIIDALDGPDTPDTSPTSYAQQKIPELNKHWRSQTRPSIRRTADLAGIDRETLSTWMKRGWWSPPTQ